MCFKKYFTLGVLKSCFLIADFDISVDVHNKRGISPMEAGCRLQMQTYIICRTGHFLKQSRK